MNKIIDKEADLEGRNLNSHKFYFVIRYKSMKKAVNIDQIENYLREIYLTAQVKNIPENYFKY